jgi:hypothetical protein
MKLFFQKLGQEDNFVRTISEHVIYQRISGKTFCLVFFALLAEPLYLTLHQITFFWPKNLGKKKVL